MKPQRAPGKPPSPASSELAGLLEQARRTTGASAATWGDRVQSLWGGYGEVRRVQLAGAATESVIVKHVTPPAGRSVSPNSAEGRSHRRKLRSYSVEQAFYRTCAAGCAEDCRVPTVFALSETKSRWCFVLEDLDAAGYPIRKNRVSSEELNACLRWLANFHATFLQQPAEGLWKIGTYWHLATRPDELAQVADRRLAAAAAGIDARLNRARFQTLVHGDAKLENFCFGAGGPSVAAVDFQYTGAGVGVKDVAYFLSSCLLPHESQTSTPIHLDLYFRELRKALQRRNPLGNSTRDVNDVEAEWRELFPFAVADLRRFLLGWAPGAYDDDLYSQRVTREVLTHL